MTLLIQKPGILTTVQDLGRNNFRRLGINPTGVMDRAAVRLINILLGNDENEAVFEMHFPSPEIVFKSNTVAAIGGGDFTATLDDKPVENWRTFFAIKNSVLKFTNKSMGNRTYLAVKGGININKWLDSSSTNLAAGIGGFQGRKLELGDRIDCKKRQKGVKSFITRRIAGSLIPIYRSFPTIRIIPGSEFENLSNKAREMLLTQDFAISYISNRMGFRLTGKPIRPTMQREILSSAVSFGTIQLLPDGQLIVLMADHQTTGGYPRIAHVITKDLPLLAQLGANDKVAFHLVETEKAEKLSLAFERELKFLRVGVKLGKD